MDGIIIGTNNNYWLFLNTIKTSKTKNCCFKNIRRQLYIDNKYFSLTNQPYYKMKKNKVVALLTALSSKELKGFEKFVRNPHNNKKEAVIRLYEFIAKNHAAYNVRKFTKAQCFLYVYPELKSQFDKLNGKTDELVTQKLKNPLSDLKKLIDEFIVLQELAVEQYDKTLLLIRGLFKRQLRERAFQLIDKELKRLEDISAKNFYHHFYQFQLRELKEQACLDIVNSDKEFFLKMINDLDLFYIHTKLKLGYEAKSRQALLGQENNILFYNELASSVAKNKINNVTPIIELYAKVSKLNEENSLEYYFTTKQFFLNNFSLLDKRDQQDILINFFNFCVKFMNEQKIDEEERFKELLDLYKFGLKHDLLINNGYLSDDHFKNIIIISSTLYKFDWARNFIDTKSYLLHPSIRESNIKLAKAQIEGACKNNEEVISLLQNVEFANAYDNITARSLLLRAYYELGEWHTLDFFLESYSKYLKRSNAISKEVQLSIINMIKFTKILMQTQFKRREKPELLKILNQLTPINGRRWLKGRVESLYT